MEQCISPEMVEGAMGAIHHGDKEDFVTDIV